MQGDCLEKMKEIESGSVDLILTDPPFGTTKCKWDVAVPLNPMWEELKRIVKPNGATLLFGTDPFSSLLRVGNLHQYKYDWIWEKPNGTGFLNAKKMPIRAHENISVFYNRLPTYNPQKTTGHKRKTAGKKPVLSDHYGKAIKKVHYDSTERYPRSVLKFSSEKQINKGLHPCLKPIALLEYLIKTYTVEGDLVLDFTMGSGSTGVAAKNLKRKFIGIEKDHEYFKIAKDRIDGRI